MTPGNRVRVVGHYPPGARLEDVGREGVVVRVCRKSCFVRLDNGAARYIHKPALKITQQIEQPAAHAPKLPASPPWLRYKLGAVKAGFDHWFLALWDKSHAHGSELVDLCVEAAHGHYSVSPADVDAVLKGAEEAGWLLRSSRPMPTVSQAAFAGLSFTQAGYDTYAKHYASHWGWSACISSVEAWEYVKALRKVGTCV